VLGIIVYRSPGLAFFASRACRSSTIVSRRFTRRMYRWAYSSSSRSPKLSNVVEETEPGYARKGLGRR